MRNFFYTLLGDLLFKIAKLSLYVPGFPRVSDEVFKELTKELDESRADIDKKIHKAHKSLIETSNLLIELESSLKERTENLYKLRDEYEKYAELASIERKKASVILDQVDSTINKGKKLERWISFFTNILAGIILFVLGIWLGPTLTKIIFK